MAKNYIELDEWAASASDDKIEAAVKAIKKRRNIFIIIWAVLFAYIAFSLIAGETDVSSAIIVAILILGLPAGIANFCNNTLCLVKSRGEKRNGGGMIFVYMLMGLFILPGFVTGICAKDRKTSGWFLGINKIVNG